MIPITNPYVMLGGVCGAALLCAVSFGLGHHQKTLEDASAALAGAKKAVVAVAAQGAANSTVDQKAVGAISKTHTDTAALLQKVQTYVPRKADDQCIIGAGAVQLLDAAGSNTVPAAPSGLPDADSGVALSSLVSDTVVNAGSYHLAVTKGSSWDDWYDAQNQAWRKEHPAP